jgi:hypothetical protein
MFDEREHEVVNSIGGILLNLMPADAVKITAKGDLGEESAGVSIEWETPTGDTKYFPFDNQPFEEIIHLSDAFISLRDLMVAGGHEAWQGIAFSVERDGQFDVDLSYDQA